MGASAWVFEQEQPFEASASLDFGRSWGDVGLNGMVTWKTEFKWEDDGSYLLHAGSACSWIISETLEFRAEWKQDFYDRRGVPDYGNGELLKLAVGFAF